MIKSFLHNFLNKEKTPAKLQIDELMYQELIDLAVDSIIVGDSNGNVIYTNTATLNLFNIPSSKIINKHISQLSWDPTSISNSPFRFDLVNAGETIRNIRTIIRPDKTQRIIEMSSKKMTNGNYQSILRDVTEIKKIEATIKESEENYRILVENINDGVIRTDEEGKITIWNKTSEKIFGLLKKETIGKYLWDVQYQIVPADKKTTAFYEQIKTNLLYILANGKFKDDFSHQNIDIIRKDGTKALINSSASIIPTSKGFTIASRISDMTEIKTFEKAVIQSEEKYQRLFENASLGIFQSTPEGKVVSINPAFAQMFGYDSPKEVLQKINNISTDIFADANRRNEIIQIMAKNPNIKNFENLYKRKDGSTFIGNLHAIPIKDSNGKVILMEGIIEDITERKEAEEALRDSERKFSDMASNSSGVVYQFFARKDGTTGFYYVSPKCEEMFGLSPDLSSPDWQDMGHAIHPDDKEMFLSDVNLAITKMKNLNHQCRMITSKGLKWVQFLSKPQLKNNEIIFNGIILDITERIEAENIIILRESYLRAIIENQPGLVWLKNEKGQFLSVNQSFASSCKMDTPTLLLGKTDFDIWPKELAQKYVDDDTHIMKTGQSNTIEEQIFDKGEIKWFETFKKPVFNKNGEIIGTTGYALDITERKKNEHALFQEKRLFEYVVESLPVMLFLKDAKELRFALMNRTGEKLLGITKEELLGKNDFDIFPKEQAEFFIKKDRETLSKKENIDISEEPILTHDKGERILRTLKVPVINKSGEAEFLLGFSSDITDQKIAEKEHAILQEQLAQSQKMESVGQLAGGIAHDFNNMLGVILGQTELVLKKTNSNNPIFLSLIEIKNAAQRSAGLTKQLLTFARKQTMTPKILDLNKTILEMISLLKSLVGENILLTWTPNKTVGNIKIDPSQLDQILANLCINAKEAIKGSGEITIKTDIVCFDEKYCKSNTDYLPGNYVQLIIADNGSGMNTETISKIFEPFFTTKGLGKGTGLGLSTVYGIVKQNNGFITVTSTPGTGTIFNVFLPKHTDKISETTKETKTLKTIESTCNKKTILLVEDEPMVREMTIGMLELQGHTVIPAESAEEALKLVKTQPTIDLLITDLIMPKMNGRELSKKILSTYPNIKCLFMSGYTADVIAKHGVLETDIHFIEKPFTIDTLNTKIHEALEK